MAQSPATQHAALDAGGGDGGSSSTVTDPVLEPNLQEARLFYSMIRNLTTQPEIDWDGVASDSGFKNAAVAKKRFYQIKQKLGLGPRMASGAPVPKASPRKPRAPKSGSTAAAATAATADASSEAGGGEPADNKPRSPQKVTKRRKVPGARPSADKEPGRGLRTPVASVVKTEDAGDDDDGGGGDSKAAAMVVKKEEEDEADYGDDKELVGMGNYWAYDAENHAV